MIINKKGISYGCNGKEYKIGDVVSVIQPGNRWEHHIGKIVEILTDGDKNTENPGVDIACDFGGIDDYVIMAPEMIEVKKGSDDLITQLVKNNPDTEIQQKKVDNKTTITRIDGNNKYAFAEDNLNNTLTLEDGTILRRIVALRYICPGVNEGDLGGFIQSKDNLSSTNECWIFDDAKVYGKAEVIERAKICQYATVCDDAKVFGNAIVRGNSKMCEWSCVYGNAQVYGDAIISGHACLRGHAHVYDYATIRGSVVCKDACTIGGNTDLNMDATIRKIYHDE